MGEVLRNVVAVVLIAVGGFLLAYLVWITATSRFFVTLFLMSLIDAALALAVVVTVLAVMGVLAWWIALPVMVLGSGALVVAIYPAAIFSLSRLRSQLKEGFLSHWHEGEASGKMAAESLPAPPSSFDEAKRMRKQLGGLALETHIKQRPEDAEDQCLAFTIAFDDAFWDSLRASGLALTWARQPAIPHITRHITWRRRRT